MNNRIELRYVTIDDAETLWHWRNDSLTRSMSLNSAEVQWSEHQDWLIRSIDNPSKTLFIGSIEENAIGIVRFDGFNSHAMVSIIINPNYRGKNLAVALLKKSIEHFHRNYNLPIIAQIKPANTASINCFTKVNFKLYKKEIDLLTYRLEDTEIKDRP